MTYCNKAVLKPQCDDTNCKKCYPDQSENKSTKHYEGDGKCYCPDCVKKEAELIENDLERMRGIRNIPENKSTNEELKKEFEDKFVADNILDCIPKQNWEEMKDEVMGFIRQKLTEAEQKGRTQQLSSTYKSSQMYQMGYKDGREEIKKLIENTDIDYAHTYGSENADDYRIYDNGQRSYKRKIIELLN